MNVPGYLTVAQTDLAVQVMNLQLTADIWHLGVSRRRRGIAGPGANSSLNWDFQRFEST